MSALLGRDRIAELVEQVALDGRRMAGAGERLNHSNNNNNNDNKNSINNVNTNDSNNNSNNDNGRAP